MFDQSLLIDKDRLKLRLKDIPKLPGCYLMLDREERILYVGKSINLCNRVKSYFQRFDDHSPRISLMVRQIFEIEFIITDNEIEALTLESNLIKDHQPYFNVLLKDDKKYPYVCITWSEKYPRLFITRRRNNRPNKDKFYGPFVDVSLLRRTVFLIKSVFPLKQRNRPLYKNRTCLNYSINRCPGVCQELISSEDYKQTLTKIEMIFQGRSDELKKLLTDKMKAYSDRQDYESATIVRDQIKGIENIGSSQKMTLPDDSLSRDIIAMESDGNICSIQLFQMRAGKLVGRLGYISQTSILEKNIILQQIIEEHYSKLDPVEIPRELLVQYQLPKQDLITDWLCTLRKKKVKIINPIRKSKTEIVELVRKNAEYELQRIKRGKESNVLALEELAELLKMNEIPRRIEGYDISHIQGSDAVGSQVVFIDGMPAKQHYRKYKIKNSSIKSGHSDDFLSMAEVIRRRFRRWSLYKKQGGNIRDLKSSKGSLFDEIPINDWPDLIMIDGGKGQLNSALKVLTELDLDTDVNICSLAKRNEEVFIPFEKTPLLTNKNDSSILILRRLRDEAHRFAISFHKQQRSKRMIRSDLSNIPGLGSKRVKELLFHFKSIDSIQLATLEDLNKVPGLGKKTAKEVWQYFNK